MSETPTVLCLSSAIASATSQKGNFGCRGSLSLGDSTYAVSGTSWMDKEFSSDPLGEGQTGWDWFCIQFDDGRDLMLFMLRDPRRTQRLGVTGAVLDSSVLVIFPIIWHSVHTSVDKPLIHLMGHQLTPLPFVIIIRPSNPDR